MITFVHTADIHFGMENYGKLDQQTGLHSRLLDFSKALNSCIDTAIERKVDFFLFSGDAYKTATPTPTHQKLLLQCFLRLFTAKIPIIIIVGNHDNPLSFGKAHALDFLGQIPLEGFHVISKPTIIPLNTKNGLVNIVGIPWPTKSMVSLQANHHYKTSSELTDYISKSMSTIIKKFADQLDPQIPAVLAGHLTVSSGIFSGSEKRAVYGTDPVFLPSQLALQPFDYVALGHLHRYQNLNPHGYPAIVYSGSVERVDFGERNEEKGFCLVTIHKKNSTTHEFIKTPTRPFLQLDVYLQGDQNHTEQVIDALKKHVLYETVIKIVYHIPTGIKDRVDTRAVQQAAAHAHYIVGIFPVRPIETREKRVTLTIDMNFEQLLNAYFTTRPEMLAQKEKLIKKALELREEATTIQDA